MATTDAEFVAEYAQLLIVQYYEKTKAKAEISAEAEQLSKVYTVLRDLYDLVPLDIDTAVGYWLDLIGKIVFGYNPRDVALTGTTLTDDQLRFFIKVKIAKNNASGYMVSDDYITIQNVVQQAFDGGAYATDNFDMAMTLYVDDSVDETLLEIVDNLSLLPKPMGVRWRAFVRYTVDGTFGFEENPQALTWDDKFGVVTNPGKFAQKIIF